MRLRCGELFVLRSHIRVGFQFQNFIQVGISWRRCFGGNFEIAITPLFINGITTFDAGEIRLASQLQKPFRPAAVFICPGATRK
jgi:hypothetical protein